MTRAALIAEHLRLAIRGPAWHGPSFDDAVGDVTLSEAQVPLYAGGHTIAQLATHIGVWARVCHGRLQGESMRPSEEEQWAPMDTSSNDTWLGGLQSVRDIHESLSAAVRVLSDEALDARAPRREHTVETMLHGVIEHAAYHGGQIMLLKKAIRARG